MTDKTEQKPALKISVRWVPDEHGHQWDPLMGGYSALPHETLSYIDRDTGELYVGKEVVRTTDVVVNMDNLLTADDRYWIAPDNGYTDDPDSVIADYLRFVGWRNGDWHYEGCVVLITLCGVELAYDSVWSVHSDSGETHHKDIEHDTIATAKSAALTILCELTAAAVGIKSSEGEDHE